MANHQKDLIDWMNEHCTDDPPTEDIAAGDIMLDPDNIAHAEKMSTAYGLAGELGVDPVWDEQTGTWSAG